MKTTAKGVDGGWLLNGTKMWITNVSCYYYCNQSSIGVTLNSLNFHYTGPRRRLHSSIRQNRTRKRKQRNHSIRRREIIIIIQRLLLRPETRQARHARIEHGRAYFRRRLRAHSERAGRSKPRRQGIDGRIGSGTARSQRWTVGVSYWH